MPLLWLQPSPWSKQSTGGHGTWVFEAPQIPCPTPPNLFSEGQITGPRKREDGFGANGQGLHIQVRVPSGALWCRTGPGVRRRDGEQVLPMLPLSGTKLQKVLEF